MNKPMRQYDHLVNSMIRASTEEIIVLSEELICSGFYVIKGKNGKKYKVEIKNNLITTCTCPHSFYRKCICKHMIKIASITNFDLATLQK